MNKDLTVGNPRTVLWKFCLPLLGSVIFQQLYNLADSFVAGKFIGNDALAAVGNGYEITMLYIAFAFGCNIGCSVTVSQLFGAKRYADVKTAVYTTMISSGILCLVLMTAGIVYCDGLLRLINTPENIMADSKLYLDIYVYGLPFVFFYNVSTGIFSALGDSTTPFIFLACSSVSNIAVDVLFVTAFDMGVAGVAWATFLCQGVSCVLAVVFVLRRLRKLESGKPKIFSFRILKKVASVAVPSIFQQSFVSVGNIIVQSVINGFNLSAVIAGYSAAIKLNNMVVTSFVTIGNGISNYSGQNLGAGKLDRVKRGFKEGIGMVWTICIPMSVLFFIFCPSLVFIFLEDRTGLAVDVGTMFLRIVSPFYFLVSLKLVADGILRGCGQMKYFMISTFTDLAIRAFLAVVLSKTALEYTGIWMSWPFGWLVATVMSVSFYFLFMKKKVPRMI